MRPSLCKTERLCCQFHHAPAAFRSAWHLRSQTLSACPPCCIWWRTPIPPAASLQEQLLLLDQPGSPCVRNWVQILPSDVAILLSGPDQPWKYNQSPALYFLYFWVQPVTFTNGFYLRVLQQVVALSSCVPPKRGLLREAQEWSSAVWDAQHVSHLSCYWLLNDSWNSVRILLKVPALFLWLTEQSCMPRPNYPSR